MFYGSNTPEMKEALTLLKEWQDEGFMDPQFGTRTYDDIHAMMVNGETGIAFGPWHMPDWGLVQAKQNDPNAEFVPYALENANGDGGSMPWLTAALGNTSWYAKVFLSRKNHGDDQSDLW